MQITTQRINELLIKEDIEDLLELGAPLDEYEYEAKNTMEALSALERTDFDKDHIVACLSVIWTKSFGLDADSLAKRLPAIQRVSEKILEAYEIV